MSDPRSRLFAPAHAAAPRRQADASQFAGHGGQHDQAADQPEPRGVEQSQFRPQAGVCEQQRQQTNHGDGLEFAGDVFDQPRVLGHDRAQ
jgi:hypothetical protein